MTEEKELLTDIDRRDSNIEQLQGLQISKRITEFELDADQNDAQKYDELRNPKIKRQCCPATYADKIITAIYGLSILCSIIMVVLYFSTDESMQQMLSMLIVVVTIWLGAIVGIIAINKGFNVADTADDLLKQNTRYYDQLRELSKTRETVLVNLKKTRNKAELLTAEEKELTASVKEFGALMGEFEHLKKSFGESWQKISNSLTESKEILSEIQNQNHRAKLFAHYYEISKDDKEEGLSKTEYDDFMDVIDKEYRMYFGTFKELDVDGNGSINKIEFDKAVSNVLEAMSKKKEP